MKRVLSALLGTVLLTSMLAACSGDTTKESSTKPDGKPSSEDTSGADDSILTEPGTYPIVKEGESVTITIFTHPTPERKVDSYDAEDGNHFAKWFEELTNVRMEFIMAPSAEEISTALTLEMNSGKIPDIMLSNNFTPAQQMLYGNQEILLEISSLVEENAPRIQSMWTDYPDTKNAVTLSGGKIYAVNQNPYPGHGTTWNKMFVYKPWLDALNMDVPETTDEFYDALIAFRDNDMNGNGDTNDEIPLIGNQSWVAWDPLVYLMSPFIYNDYEGNIHVDNGNVFAAYTKDEYREGLRWINKLYSEGLISPETFSLTDMSAYKTIANQEDNIVGFMPSHAPFTATEIHYPDFVAVPPLTGPNGVKYSMKNNVIPSNGPVISADVEYPEVAIRVLDALFDPEVNVRADVGLEGEEWRYAEDGELNDKGQQAKFYRLTEGSQYDPEKGERNTQWPMAMYLRNEFGEGGDTSVYDTYGALWALTSEQTGDDLIKPLEEATINLYEPAFPASDTLLPPNIVYADADIAESADLEVVISETVSSWMMRFILGEADLDTQWDDFQSELEAAGLSRYLEIIQTAYTDMQ